MAKQQRISGDKRIDLEFLSYSSQPDPVGQFTHSPTLGVHHARSLYPLPIRPNGHVGPPCSSRDRKRQLIVIRIHRLELKAVRCISRFTHDVDARPAADLAQEPKLTNSDSILIEEDSKRALVRTDYEG